jgi:putative ABC transport system permease protein
MIALTLALRNLWKNRRRSLATLLAIAVGFAAINLFAGYVRDVYQGLRAAAIHGEGLGHLTIAKRGFFEGGSLNPAHFIFNKAEMDRLRAIIVSEPGVVLATPQLSASGLVSNGKLSTIFIADGEDPEAAGRLRANPLRSAEPAQAGLDPSRPAAGLVSQDLAGMLGAASGSSLTVMTTTLAGQTNALDLDVIGTWDTGTAASNDKFLRLPLAYVQQLLDTDGASRVVVLLDESLDADRMRAALGAKLGAAGFDVDMRTWVERSNFYRQVKNLFDLIFLFLFSIVFIVVLMSIVNTLSMSVMERVREIGTLRALGMRKGGVVRLFAVEGGVLGAFGCLFGAAFTGVTAAAVNAAHIQYTPPSSSNPVPLTVAVVSGTLAGSLLVLSLVAMLAACWPARRAARVEIVDALGHV